MLAVRGVAAPTVGGGSGSRLERLRRHRENIRRCARELGIDLGGGGGRGGASSSSPATDSAAALTPSSRTSTAAASSSRGAPRSRRHGDGDAAAWAGVESQASRSGDASAIATQSRGDVDRASSHGTKAVWGGDSGDVAVPIRSSAASSGQSFSGDLAPRGSDDHGVVATIASGTGRHAGASSPAAREEPPSMSDDIYALLEHYDGGRAGVGFGGGRPPQQAPENALAGTAGLDDVGRVLGWEPRRTTPGAAAATNPHLGDALCGDVVVAGGTSGSAGVAEGSVSRQAAGCLGATIDSGGSESGALASSFDDPSALGGSGSLGASGFASASGLEMSPAAIGALSLGEGRADPYLVSSPEVLRFAGTSPIPGSLECALAASSPATASSGTSGGAARGGIGAGFPDVPAAAGPRACTADITAVGSTPQASLGGDDAELADPSFGSILERWKRRYSDFQRIAAGEAAQPAAPSPPPSYGGIVAGAGAAEVQGPRGGGSGDLLECEAALQRIKQDLGLDFLDGEPTQPPKQMPAATPLFADGPFELPEIGGCKAGVGSALNTADTCCAALMPKIHGVFAGDAAGCRPPPLPSFMDAWHPPALAPTPEASPDVAKRWGSEVGALSTGIASNAAGSATRRSALDCDANAPGSATRRSAPDRDSNTPGGATRRSALDRDSNTPCSAIRRSPSACDASGAAIRRVVEDGGHGVGAADSGAVATVSYATAAGDGDEGCKSGDNDALLARFKELEAEVQRLKEAEMQRVTAGVEAPPITPASAAPRREQPVLDIAGGSGESCLALFPGADAEVPGAAGLQSPVAVPRAVAFAGTADLGSAAGRLDSSLAFSALSCSLSSDVEGLHAHLPCLGEAELPAVPPAAAVSHSTSEPARREFVAEESGEPPAWSPAEPPAEPPALPPASTSCEPLAPCVELVTDPSSHSAEPKVVAEPSVKSPSAPCRVAVEPPVAIDSEGGDSGGSTAPRPPRVEGGSIIGGDSNSAGSIQAGMRSTGDGGGGSSDSAAAAQREAPTNECVGVPPSANADGTVAGVGEECAPTVGGGGGALGGLASKPSPPKPTGRGSAAGSVGRAAGPLRNGTASAGAGPLPPPAALPSKAPRVGCHDVATAPSRGFVPPQIAAPPSPLTVPHVGHQDSAAALQRGFIAPQMAAPPSPRHTAALGDRAHAVGGHASRATVGPSRAPSPAWWPQEPTPTASSLACGSPPRSPVSDWLVGKSLPQTPAMLGSGGLGSRPSLATAPPPRAPADVFGEGSATARAPTAASPLAASAPALSMHGFDVLAHASGRHHGGSPLDLPTMAGMPSVALPAAPAIAATAATSVGSENAQLMRAYEVYRQQQLELLRPVK